MLQATNQLGIEVFVPYWEFAYGIERVREFFGDRETRGLFTGDFVAHNVADISWGPPGDPVFHPYTITEVGGIKVGIIGQAFPYTAISHLQRFVPNLTFGIQADRLLWRLLAYRLPDAEVVGTVSCLRWQIALTFQHWEALLQLHVLKGTCPERIP